ncbi:MAG: phage tail protein [Burkholderia gladioli]
MNKIEALREAIAAAVPGLIQNPDRLQLFVDDGRIVATAGPSVSFEYRYAARIVMLDFPGPTDAVMAAMVAWAHRYQPDLFQNRDNCEHGITFEADLLNHETADLSTRIKLTESVVVTERADGTRTFAHVDDSRPGNIDWDGAGFLAPRDLAIGAIPRK